MKGVIVHTNSERGMYSARLPNGSFVVFELVDPVELDSNTEVTGELEATGNREITTNGSGRLHIYIDHCGLDETLAFKRTFLLA